MRLVIVNVIAGIVTGALTFVIAALLTHASQYGNHDLIVPMLGVASLTIWAFGGLGTRRRSRRRPRT